MVNHDNDFLDIERLRNTLKVKRVNDELLEYLASSLRWVVHYCRKYNMPLPEDEKIIDLCNRAIEIERKLPKVSDDLLQQHNSRSSDEDVPEPYIAHIVCRKFFSRHNPLNYYAIINSKS